MSRSAILMQAAVRLQWLNGVLVVKSEFHFRKVCITKHLVHDHLGTMQPWSQERITNHLVCIHSITTRFPRKPTEFASQCYKKKGPNVSTISYIAMVPTRFSITDRCATPSTDG